jgi:hypothetical protein
MSEEEIKDNPRLKKLREDAEQFRNFGRIWPILRPFAKLLGADTARIDECLGEAARLAKQVDEMTAIPDKFNSIFSDRGWILFDSMDLKVAREAIKIAEKDGVDKADEFLVEHFSPDWIETRMIWLKHITGFQERFELAQMALEDYRAGRFYSSVLITLSLIDGWVNELNIVDFHRHGFFSETSQLMAWDSIAAHPKGLVKLQAVFGRPRMMTRTEEIRIPYRHGIMHGMDLGYDNRYVAAKCWAALFAVRDWAIKAARGELNPPKLEPEIEKTLWESIEEFQRIREETEQLRKWQPRQVVVGESIPSTGPAQDYPSDTPEHKIVEFLNYWLVDNYGFMARCYAPMLETKPVEVRESFQHRQLLEFELVEVNDIAPTITDVKVKLKIRTENGISSPTYEFRLVGSNTEGDLVYRPSDNMVWGITTWRAAQ